MEWYFALEWDSIVCQFENGVVFCVILEWSGMVFYVKEDRCTVVLYFESQRSGVLCQMGWYFVSEWRDIMCTV